MESVRLPENQQSSTIPIVKSPNSNPISNSSSRSQSPCLLSQYGGSPLHHSPSSIRSLSPRPLQTSSNQIPCTQSQNDLLSRRQKLSLTKPGAKHHKRIERRTSNWLEIPGLPKNCFHVRSSFIKQRRPIPRKGSAVFLKMDTIQD